MFKRGDIVECVEDGRDYNDYGVTVGKQYVVNAIERHHEADYLVVLDDTKRGQTLLHSMFRPLPATE